MDKKKKFAAGFTLVEALVAVSVLLVAIVGPMSIAAQGLQASFFAREQTTAVYLAQEAIESIEHMRDERALTEIYSVSPRIWHLCQNDVLPAGPGEPIYENNPPGSPYRDPNVCELNTWDWYDELIDDDGPDCDDTGCDYDAVNDTFHACDSANACRLLEDENYANGRYYQYIDGDPSEFTRVITLSEAPGTDDEVLVSVEVSWQATLFGGSDSSVILQTRIFDQYE